MTEAKVLDEGEAAGMTRAEALRALAMSEGVPDRDRRMAEMMLAGPDIEAADHRLLGTVPRLKPMVRAVRLALVQRIGELRLERAADEADLARFAG